MEPANVTIRSWDKTIIRSQDIEQKATIQSQENNDTEPENVTIRSSQMQQYRARKKSKKQQYKARKTMIQS